MNDYRLIKAMKEGNLEIAIKNIEGAFNWIVGGYYNEMIDNPDTSIPSEESIKMEIYECSHENNYLEEGAEIRKYVPEMGSVTNEFVKTYIDYLWKVDADAKVISEKIVSELKIFPVRLREVIETTVLVRAKNLNSAIRTMEMNWELGDVEFNDNPDFTDCSVLPVEEYADGFNKLSDLDDTYLFDIVDTDIIYKEDK